VAGGFPPIELKLFDQVAHGLGIFGGAAGPDKAGFNAAVIGVSNIHWRSFRGVGHCFRSIRAKAAKAALIGPKLMSSL
jgi:hypothetical protein